jgi:hypothetical protein
VLVSRARLTSGSPKKTEISTRLGRSTIRTTLDTYGHLLPGLDEAAADRLDQLIAEGLGADPGQIRM